jgi:uncharacterized protein YtpQ (UPF0354 family)
MAGLNGRAQSAQALPSAPPAGSKDDIVPLVRSFTGAIRKVQDIKPLTGMKLTGLEHQTGLLPLIDTFVGDLDIRYAFDADSGFRYLNESDLKTLGLPRDQLLRLALTNFHRRYPKISVERPVAFVGKLANGGELEPSMMLDADFWEKEKVRFGGEIVAAAPTRDVLWFTGLKPIENVRNLQVNTERSHKEAGERAISKLMYLWRNKRWEVLEG